MPNEVIPNYANKTTEALGRAFDEGFAGAFSNEEYRHPKEKKWLYIGWFMILLIIWISAAITIGSVFVYLFIMSIYFSIKHWQLKTNAQELQSHGEHAWLYKFINETSQRLGLRRVPSLYVNGDPTYNAYTTGILEHFIVVTSGIFQICDEDEIKAIVAHEMGHIKFKHVPNMIILNAGNAQNGIETLLALPLIILGKVLFVWGLYAEYTSDRTSLYICNQKSYTWINTDIHPLVRGLLKVSRGPRFGASTTWEEVVDTFNKLRRNPLSWIAQLFNNHPHLYRRAYFAKEFYEKITKQPTNNPPAILGEEELNNEYKRILNSGLLDESVKYGSALAHQYIKKENFDEAVEVYKKFHAIFPKYSFLPEIQFEICKHLQNKEQYDLCAKSYRNFTLVQNSF